MLKNTPLILKDKNLNTCVFVAGFKGCLTLFYKLRVYDSEFTTSLLFEECHVPIIHTRKQLIILTLWSFTSPFLRSHLFPLLLV